MPMTRRLEVLPLAVVPDRILSFNREKSDRLKKQVDAAPSAHQLLALLPQYAQQLLYAGRTIEAIKQLNRLEKLWKSIAPADWAANRAGVRMELAVAYLRLGEQENCLLRRSCESCILPLKGGAVHRAQRGSRNAIPLLEEVLRGDPGDLSARWLLNIAYMTLGEHPAKVPARWRIPAEAFRSDYPLKQFTDIAAQVGLDVHALSGGVILEDFNGDDCLDVLTSSVGLRDQLRYFQSSGEGRFVERTREAGLAGQTGGLNLIQTDYNNDGFPDAMVLRGGWFGDQGCWPLSLLRNNGNGTFTDVTEQAGLLRFHPTQTAVWFDYNADGWLDVFVGNESPAGMVHPCELFRNNGNGTFTECAAESGLAIVGMVKAAVGGDFNNDGRPDLYLSIHGGENILLRNDGPRGGDRSAGLWMFADVTAQAGVSQPKDSFSCMFFDYDNDGWQDLFVTGYRLSGSGVGAVAADYLGKPTSAERPRLYRNRGDGTFADVTVEARLNKVLWGMGMNFGDLDNDGWLDFYVGTGNPNLSVLVPNRMFRNAGGKRFQDVTSSGGFGHLQKGHGIGFGDLNNDGAQDIYESMGGIYDGDTAFNTLYENPGHGNHWLTLKLQGVRSNRAAVGARIRVTVETPSGLRDIYKTVGSGGSFGASPFRQEIGLGDARHIEQVEIRWPTSGRTQLLQGLAKDSFYQVREGEAAARVLPIRPFRFAGPSRGAALTSTH